MRWVYWVLAAINAVAAFAIGAARQNWPRDFWNNYPTWLLVSLGITAAVPMIQLATNEHRQRQQRQGLQRRMDLDALLTSALIQMARHAGADWETTGVQLFLVKRCGALWLKEEHVRVAKVRLGALASSGVRWAKGKGVIGRCWEAQQAQYEDIDRQFALFQDHTKEQWDALSEKSRYGLSFADFQRVKGKYGIVAAVPITDRNDKYIGCVTVDMQPKRTANKAEVVKSLTSTASVVKGMI